MMRAPRKIAILMLSLGLGLRLGAAEEWFLLGPFPSQGGQQDKLGLDRDYLQQGGGEALARGASGKIMCAKSWISGPEMSEEINFMDYYPGASDAVAYAYREISSERDTYAALGLGSDDGIKVWINGRLVFRRRVFRSLKPNDDLLRVRLNKGINRFLVKVEQGGGDWGLCLRLMDLAAHQSKLRPALGLEIIQDQSLLEPGSELSFLSRSYPDRFLGEAFEYRLLSQGSALASGQGELGSLSTVRLPQKAQGDLILELRGKGRLAGLSCTSSFLVGSASALQAQALSQAKALLGSRQGQAAAGIDLGAAGAESIHRASVDFLRASLEGDFHPSLRTGERLGRALVELRGLLATSPKATLERTGLHQLAYYSSLDGSPQPFSLYLPPDYPAAVKAGRRLPLVIVLHGYSGNDWDAGLSLTKGHPHGYIVASAFGRGDTAYSIQGERDVLDVLELCQRLLPVDRTRVSITGFSMGGLGAWRIGQLFADRFAAVVPFCGWTGVDYLGTLSNTASLIVHGNADPTVPIDYDQAAFSRLKELGAPTRMDTIEGGGHGAYEDWTDSHGMNALFDYLGDKSLRPWPERIYLTAPSLAYARSHFWLKALASPKPWQDLSAIATVEDKTHLRIECQNLSALALDLGHPALTQKGRISLRINGREWLCEAGKGSVVFEDDGAGLRPSRLPLADVRDRNANTGLGFAGLYGGPLYIVYGSLKREKELKNLAQVLADWTETDSFAAGLKVGVSRVIRDKDLNPALASSAQLILVGGPEENSISKSLSPYLFPRPLAKGGFRVNGTDYPKSFLALRQRNPRYPTLSLGLILPNLDRSENLRACAYMNMTMRMYKIAEGTIGGASLPDCLVMGQGGHEEFSGGFDSSDQVLSDWR